MTAKKQVFVSVTNQEIYDELRRNHETNVEQHHAIIQRLDTTNGKVKLSKWIGTTALTVALIAIGYLISHIGR
jgi:hypothetical protein